jgi:hypothetical protein
MRVQMRMRTLLGTGLEYYLVVKKLCTFCSSLKSLWEAECKGERVIDLTEEISRQPRIQAVTWVLLNAFSLIYFENCEQISKNNSKILAVWSEREHA